MTDSPSLPTSSGLSLSIVIPAHNEASRLGPTLDRIGEYLAAAGHRAETIVVDDGSRDETAEIARGHDRPGPPVRVIITPANRGKGHAVRTGVLAAGGDVILMCDADLSAPIEELEKLLPWLDRDCDIVIGSRDMPDSVVNPAQPPLRRWLAAGFRWLRRRVLLPDLRDTQCGFKCFRRQVAREVLRQQQVDGWLFDCEVLAIARHLGYRVKEVGIVWRDNRHSRVKPLRVAWGALPTLLRIRRRLRHIRHSQTP